MSDPQSPQMPLQRRTTRRAVIGGTLAAGTVALAYAAFGDNLRQSGSAADLVSTTTDAEAGALGKESVRISHLLRRAGFGASPEEYDRYQTMGLEATTAELVNYTTVDDQQAIDLASQVPLEPQNRSTPPVWWLTRMANTKRPLQEKMTLFWHGLLTSQTSVVRDPTAMVAQNELLRRHAFDDLPAILRAVTFDRAMMVYLDTAGSQRRAPNENYARELMELFALGEGNYTEQDVREAARAFTGWAVPRNRLDGVAFTLEAPVFRQQQFDNGSKTFLGRTGNFRPEDIVQIITEQPQASKHIVSRLFAFFVYPDPSDDDLEPFVRVFDHNQQRVGPVVEALLRSDVFYSPRAYRALVKSPVEYVVGAMKALGLQTRATQLLQAESVRGGDGGVLGAMGQVLFEPPNVAGWPSGKQWLNSSTIYARLNFVNTLTGGGVFELRGADRQQRPNQTRQPVVDLPPFAKASEGLTHYLPLLLDDNVPDAARQALVDYAGGADTSLTPEMQRGLVYLLLATPQFHLA